MLTATRVSRLYWSSQAKTTTVDSLPKVSALLRAYTLTSCALTRASHLFQENALPGACSFSSAAIACLGRGEGPKDEMLRVSTSWWQSWSTQKLTTRCDLDSILPFLLLPVTCWAGVNLHGLEICTWFITLPVVLGHYLQLWVSFVHQMSEAEMNLRTWWGSEWDKCPPDLTLLHWCFVFAFLSLWTSSPRFW